LGSRIVDPEGYFMVVSPADRDPVDVARTPD